MNKLVEMRGFKFCGDPVYPDTGFESFECLDCHKNVKIQGKRIFEMPLRWVTWGFCKTPGCRMQGNSIPTRIEYIDPKTRLIQIIAREEE